MPVTPVIKKLFHITKKNNVKNKKKRTYRHVSIYLLQMEFVVVVVAVERSSLVVVPKQLEVVQNHHLEESVD